jgi:predicted membrane protein
MQNEELQEQQTGKKFRRRRKNNVIAGLFLLFAATVITIRQVEPSLVPGWLFSWPMILIVVGFFVGILTRFRDFAWLILMGIGAFFLADRAITDFDAGRFIIPVAIAGVGLILIFASGRKKHRDKDEDRGLYYKVTVGTVDEPEPETEEYPGKHSPDGIDAVSIFGNVKKVIYSKNFQGGEIVSIFGGAEINLSQADFKSPIILEIVQIFSGAKLIVPPHWTIRSEAVAIFGGIEDKRPPQAHVNTDKVLILQGTALFAGIEIRSY